MNREIKFRAWHPDAKDMVYFGLGENNFSAYDKYGEQWAMEDANDYPVMQYTGLKDKNGVEIYEGDIVEADVNMFFDKGREQKQVIYENGAFVYGKNGVHLSILFPSFHPVVIGNIHENPQLI